MNAYLEGTAFIKSGPRQSHRYPTYLCYVKMNDIVGSAPGPASLWAFVDEHPDTIDDAYLIIDPTDNDRWFNLPASYHNGAAGFTFADGHSEIHKWRVSKTVKPVTKVYIAGKSVLSPGSEDIKWMQAHSTAPFQN